MNYEHAAGDLATILDGLNVQAIAYDRWRIDLLCKELGKICAELSLLEWGQRYKNMAPALDALEAVLLNARMAHGASRFDDVRCQYRGRKRRSSEPGS